MMADDDIDQPKLAALMSTPTVFEEADATPDEAYELGYVKGMDDAYERAVQWATDHLTTEQIHSLVDYLLKSMTREETKRG